MAISRYLLFRKLMDFVSDDYDVTDADMSNYADEIEIFGASPDGDIAITVKLIDVKEEVSGDGD